MKRPRRRFYFVDCNSFPERCTKPNYDFWKKDFTVVKLNPLKHIRGWNEKVVNSFGAIVGYAL